MSTSSRKSRWSKNRSHSRSGRWCRRGNGRCQLRPAAAGSTTLLQVQLEGLSPAAARNEALFMLTSMIGAVTMARVVTDPAVSTTILRQARKHLTPKE